MKFGLGSYGCAWAVGVAGKMPGEPLSHQRFIDMAAGYGLECVEIDDNLPLHNIPSSALLALNDYAQSRGIEIIPGARDMQPDNLERYIEIASSIKSPILRFVIDGPHYTPTMQEVAHVLKPYLSEFSRHDITLALENHDRFLSTQFADLIQVLGSSNVGICLDSVNSMGAGEGIQEVVKNLAPYTVHFHIKEFTIKRIWHKMGFQIEGAPLGKGMLPLSEILDHIAPRCQRGIYESWVPEQPTLEETLSIEQQWLDEGMAVLSQLNR
jgi:sugar phosphate isomerase/epimerase